MRRHIVPLALAIGVATPLAGQSRPVDWDALGREGATALADYLRVNTTNPPGNELAGARYLLALLDREGIEARILDTAELGKGRANLYARLRGDGSKRAIALVHHIDVVPAATEFWTIPPFSGAMRDGWIHGRGAYDMKGDGIIHLMAMIALKRSGARLTRDIVYIANADEELGSTGGVVFASRHGDLLRDVEYMLTEGGANLVRDGRIAYVGVGVAEKRTFWQELTVRGVPSHASRPTPQNPVPRLVAALARIAAYETPLHVTPGVARYFRDLARTYEGERHRWLVDVRRALSDPRAREWILGDVYWNAILRNTISLTVLEGSNKTNVIPPVARANLDIRLLPDQNPDSMLASLKRLAADSSIVWRTTMAPKAPLENPVDTELFRAIERATADHAPGAFVTTPMLTAATDRPTYRALGIVTYGLDPWRTDPAERQRVMHGNDERVPIADLAWGARFVFDVLRYAQ